MNHVYHWGVGVEKLYTGVSDMGKYCPVKQDSIFVVAVHGVQNLCITRFVCFSGSVRSRRFDFWSIHEQSKFYNFVYCIFLFTP